MNINNYRNVIDKLSPYGAKLIVVSKYKSFDEIETVKNWGQNIIEQIPLDSTFWDRKLICKMWDEHQEFKIDHTERIWNILLLESFFKRKKMLHHSFGI